MRSIGCLLLLTVLYTGFTSCQKEITGLVTTADSAGGGGNIPPSTNGDLLVKLYGKATTGLDSNVSVYTYNSAKKMISWNSHVLTYSSDANLKTFVRSWWSYERDSSGLITKKRSYQFNSRNPAASDTSVTMYYYTTGSSPVLKYSINITNQAGFISTDSTVYTFSSAGRVTKSESYETNFLITTPTLSSRIVYSYDANGNESKKESYLITGGIAISSGTQTFEWDNRTPSQIFTESESLVISDDPAPAHNPTKTVLNSLGINSTNTFTYTYNSAGKPATSVLKAVNPGFPDFTTNFTLYYQ